MKTIYLYFIVGAIAFLPIKSKAQNQTFSQGISVSQNQTERKGDKLYVNFNIEINQPDISSNQGIILTPIIQSDNKIKNLPQVIMNRRNRNISYNRTTRNNDKSGFYNEPYSVMEISRNSEIIIQYRMVIPFEAWMKNSTLLLQEDICCCRNTIRNFTKQTIAQNIGAFYDVKPLLTYLSPTIKSLQNQKDSISSVLFFPEGVTTILPEYGQNRQNMVKIDSVLANKNIIITEVKIIGAASPRGEYDFNEQLSKERALALSSYIKTRHNIPSEHNKTEWIGEDWHTLLKLVSASDMQYKQQAIDIIKGVNVSAERKNDLKKLESGKPYQYIQEYFYPQLRWVSCTIYYQATPFNITEGRKLIITAPQSLSANQMLLVADSYPKNSDEYKKVIDLAVKTYPSDKIANINASSVALSKGDTAVAKQYLKPFEKWPESWNNLGVVYLLEGNIQSAYKYFQKAIDSGSADAIRNMEYLKQK